MFQQVSNESSSFSSGKAEIKRSIAKRQVGLDPTGEIQSIPKGYAATLKGKQTKHGDSEAIWMGQKGKFSKYGRRTNSALLSFSVWGMMEDVETKDERKA